MSKCKSFFSLLNLPCNARHVRLKSKAQVFLQEIVGGLANKIYGCYTDNEDDMVLTKFSKKVVDFLDIKKVKPPCHLSWYGSVCMHVLTGFIL